MQVYVELLLVLRNLRRCKHDNLIIAYPMKWAHFYDKQHLFSCMPPIAKAILGQLLWQGEQLGQNILSPFIKTRIPRNGVSHTLIGQNPIRHCHFLVLFVCLFFLARQPDIAVGHTLKFYVKVFSCDGQGTVIPAILYADSSCR